MSRPVKRIRAEEQPLQASASVSASSSSAGSLAAAPAAAPDPNASGARPQSRAAEILHEPQLWADILMFLPFEDIKQCTAVDHYFLREVSPCISYGDDFVLKIKVTPFLAMLHYPWQSEEDRTPDWYPISYKAIDQILPAYIKNIKKSNIANYDGKDLMGIIREAQQIATELPCRFRQVERIKLVQGESTISFLPVKPRLIRYVLSSHTSIKCLGIFGLDSNKDYSPYDDTKMVVSEFEEAFNLARSTLKELIIHADIPPENFVPAIGSTCKALSCLQLAFTEIVMEIIANGNRDWEDIARPLHHLAFLPQLEYLTLSDMTNNSDYELTDIFCTVINKACASLLSLKHLRSQFLMSMGDSNNAVIARLAKLEDFGVVQFSYAEFWNKLAQHEIFAKKLACSFSNPAEDDIPAFVNALMSRAHHLESLDLQINIDDTYETVHGIVSALCRLKDHPRLKNIRFHHLSGYGYFVENYGSCLTKLEKALEGSAVRTFILASKDNDDFVPRVREKSQFIL